MLVGIEFAGNFGFTFAHFLRDQGHQVVSVLGSHSKRWKEVVHNQPLKTDPSDAITITGLVAQGRFVGFSFLEQVYADLRYLVSTRQRLLKLRNGAINRLKEVLQVVWPEFERRHRDLTQKTPIALLQEFPGPVAFLAAPKRRVLRVMKEASRNHLKLAHYEELAEGARHTGAQGVLKEEIGLQLELLATYERQLDTVDALMTATLKAAPEMEALLSIPKLGAPTAAVFLGSIGDPRAYESSRQALRAAGLTLVTSDQSGMRTDHPRISKRGRPNSGAWHTCSRSATSTRMASSGRNTSACSSVTATTAIPALTSLSRRAIRLMFSIAKERRLYTMEPAPVGSGSQVVRRAGWRGACSPSYSAPDTGRGSVAEQIHRRGFDSLPTDGIAPPAPKARPSLMGVSRAACGASQNMKVSSYASLRSLGAI